MIEDDIIPSRTDVLSMAREAGFEPEIVLEGQHAPYAEEWLCKMKRFAQAAYAAGAAAEREECQKACDELAGLLFCHGDKSGAEIAISLRDAIRARGQA